MLGTFPDNGGYAMASETPSLKAMGASYRREVARGEMIVCGPNGSLESSFPFTEKPSKLCAFEFVYFSGPHSKLAGRNVYSVRNELGRLLAIEHPADADLVIGIPDSGLPAAFGYSRGSGIPLGMGIAKNPYIGRTFILPDQESRVEAVQDKLNVIGAEVYGKRLAVIDDSIVRGTTIREIVAILWEEGVEEIHLRISSAPYLWPCYYGLNTRKPGELVANQYPDMDELRRYLEVTSIGYLSIAGVRAAAADAAGELCLACMDGRYPTDVSDQFSDEENAKLALVQFMGR
jgi:amidophosphoribosyltransferase